MILQQVSGQILRMFVYLLHQDLQDLQELQEAMETKANDRYKGISTLQLLVIRILLQVAALEHIIFHKVK